MVAAALIVLLTVPGARALAPRFDGCAFGRRGDDGLFLEDEFAAVGDDDGVDGVVEGVHRDGFEAADHVHSGDDVAEEGVFLCEVLAFCEGDEESSCG